MTTKKERLKIVNKLAVTLVATAFLLTGCSKDESPYRYSSESTIYSQSNQRVLRELMFMLKPYKIHEGSKKYIVVSSIDNIRVLINGDEWGVFSSFDVDISNINKETADNFYVRSEPVPYVTKAPYVMSSDILTTAGEYSEMLGRYISLQPGGYIFQIEYIELTDISGNTHRVYPLIAKHFEVTENIVSAFIGEFEILID
jgi:hypothetical protein